MEGLVEYNELSWDVVSGTKLRCLIWWRFDDWKCFKDLNASRCGNASWYDDINNWKKDVTGMISLLIAFENWDNQIDCMEIGWMANNGLI